MKAAPGTELACRAHNLPATHPDGPRGVISYFTTLALFDATTVGDWLARTEALMRADVRAGKLPPFYRPELQVLGADNQPAPGTPL
jgi:hypothetical protein